MQQLNILDDIEENEVIEELVLENNTWKECNLGDLVTLNYGKALPERDRIKGDIPVYSSSGITGWHNKFLTEEKSIIVGRKGSVGTVFYSDQPFFCIDTAYYITENKENYNLKYVYYLLKTLSLEKLNEDSAVPGLNRNTAYAQKFMLPPLEEQEQIAKILTSLDDKIELNQKMNKTLEEVAQAIFKHWFIDFEFPNEEGKEYKSSGGEMVDSELGDIPKGWKHGKLNEEFNITMGQSPPGSTYNEIGEGVPFFQGRTDFTFRFPEYRIYCTEPKRFAESFDTLVSVRAPVGDMNMSREKCCIGRGLAAVIHKLGYSSYTYYKLNSLTVAFKSFESEGTVFGAINRQSFENISIIVPENIQIKAFQEIVSKMDNLIYNISNEIKNLTEIRDSLLPKLMSGEIRTNSSPNPFSPAFKGSKEGGQES